MLKQALCWSVFLTLWPVIWHFFYYLAIFQQFWMPNNLCEKATWGFVLNTGNNTVDSSNKKQKVLQRNPFHLTLHWKLPWVKIKHDLVLPQIFVMAKIYVSSVCLPSMFTMFLKTFWAKIFEYWFSGDMKD